MTKEERQMVFDTVVEALLKQGKPSSNEDECLYRGPRGLKCAIGHLIPDESYNPNIESSSVSGLIPFRAVCTTGVVEVTSDDSHFICDIQNKLHDNLTESKFIEDLTLAAAKFADSYELGVPSCVKQVMP